MSVSNFIHELSVLKMLPRSGSFIAGIRNPDTVGEHVFRASQIAFILAELEGGLGERASFLITIHDNAEARIGDMHRITSRYISNKKEAEKRAFMEQVSFLPQKIQEKYIAAFTEFETGKTLESICAKDADLLECGFQAKEFVEQGYIKMQDWVDNVGRGLQTDSAKNIFAEMIKGSCFDWTEGLKKL